MKWMCTFMGTAQALFAISLAMSLFVAPGVVDAMVVESLNTHSKQWYGK